MIFFLVSLLFQVYLNLRSKKKYFESIFVDLNAIKVDFIKVIINSETNHNMTLRGKCEANVNIYFIQTLMWGLYAFMFGLTVSFDEHSFA